MLSITGQQGELQGGSVVREAIAGESVRVDGATSVELLAGNASIDGTSVTFGAPGIVRLRLVEYGRGTTQTFYVFPARALEDQRLVNASRDSAGTASHDRARLILRSLCGAASEASFIAAIASADVFTAALIGGHADEGLCLANFGGSSLPPAHRHEGVFRR